MDARQAGWFLRAFGDGTRLRILAALSQGALSVGELCRGLRRPPSSVSRHLAYLRERGLVESQKVRNSAVYHLVSPADPFERGMLAAFIGSLGSINEVLPDRKRTRRSSKRPPAGS